MSDGEEQDRSERRARRARARHPAPRLHLQLHRPPDHRRPRRADQGGAGADRHPAGPDGRDRLRALLFGPRHPDRLARRPQEPGQHHRRLGRLVERCSPPPAASPRISGSCSSRGWASASARRAASRLPTRWSPIIFPKERRARALAFFSLGIPIGSALGVFFGGWIATHLDWRSAFLIVGLAGLPAALLVKFGISEPVRGGFDSADGAAERAGAALPAGRGDAGANAELLAALLRRRLGLDPRLRPDLLAAELLRPQLRAGAGRGRLVLRLDRPGRRSRRHLARRLARRPHRPRRSRLLCAASRPLLPDRRARSSRSACSRRRSGSAGCCSRSARCSRSPGSARSSPPSSTSSRPTCARPPRPASCSSTI